MKNDPLKVVQAVLITTIAFHTSPVGGQQRMQMPDATEITVTAQSGVPEIPFELVNNHLIVPVSVNGSALLKGR